jgi:hypothetical protein
MTREGIRVLSSTKQLNNTMGTDPVLFRLHLGTTSVSANTIRVYFFGTPI